LQPQIAAKNAASCGIYAGPEPNGVNYG